MSKKIDRVEAKKRELEADLVRLQSGLETNLVNVKSDVTKTIHPAQVVRKYPLPMVGAAVIAGYLLTRIGKSKPKKSVSNSNIIAESIGSSLKKRLSKKATDIVLDYIEDRIKSNSGFIGDKED